MLVAPTSKGGWQFSFQARRFIAKPHRCSEPVRVSGIGLPEKVGELFLLDSSLIRQSPSLDFIESRYKIMFGHKERQIRRTSEVLSQTSERLTATVALLERTTQLAKEAADQRDRWQRLYEGLQAIDDNYAAFVAKQPDWLEQLVLLPDPRGNIET
jgi:hypothetical protein